LLEPRESRIVSEAPTSVSATPWAFLR
jgi:hypothetical protein